MEAFVREMPKGQCRSTLERFGYPTVKFAQALIRRHYDTRSYSSMSDTVTVTISHRLGRAEAIRRLKEGLAQTKGHLGAMIAMEQETWEGDTLRFRMRALGLNAAASIEVLEDALRIEVSLPW